VPSSSSEMANPAKTPKILDHHGGQSPTLKIAFFCGHEGPRYRTNLPSYTRHLKEKGPSIAHNDWRAQKLVLRVKRETQLHV